MDVSEPDLLSCPCTECGGPISYGPAMEDTEQVCPHCRQLTIVAQPRARVAPVPAATGEQRSCPCTECGGTIAYTADMEDTEQTCPHCRLLTIVAQPRRVELPQERAASDPAATHEEWNVADEEDADAARHCPKCHAAVVTPTATVCGECGHTLPPPRNWVRIGLASVVGLQVVIILLQWFTNIPGLGLKNRTRAALKVQLKMAPKKLINEARDPDLVLLKHSLEKKKDTNFTYVRGTVRNNSDYRYLGITVAFEMVDRAGQPLGRCTAYLDILEPKKDWAFEALVLDPDAVSYKVLPIDARR